MTNTRFMTIAAALAVTAGVIGTSTSAQAVSSDAVKRAIITIVLKNLGVEPTNAIVDGLVADLPNGLLAQNLVDQVGSALDAGDDPTLIIGQSVDSNGDGVPDESGAIDNETDDGSDDSSDDSADESGDDSSDDSGDSSNHSTDNASNHHSNSSSHNSNSNDDSDDNSNDNGSSGSGGEDDSDDGEDD